METPPPALARPSLQPWLWAGFIALIMAVPLLRQRLELPLPPPPVLGSVPAFRLVDQTGAVFGPERLAGRVWVANFIFTRCPSICPEMTGRLVRLQPRLGEAVELVSVSVDPDYDTPEQMRAFAERHRANSPRWHFLTGAGHPRFQGRFHPRRRRLSRHRPRRSPGAGRRAGPDSRLLRLQRHRGLGASGPRCQTTDRPAQRLRAAGGGFLSAPSASGTRASAAWTTSSWGLCASGPAWRAPPGASEPPLSVGWAWARRAESTVALGSLGRQGMESQGDEQPAWTEPMEEGGARRPDDGRRSPPGDRARPGSAVPSGAGSGDPLGASLRFERWYPSG
jgi:SCO1/SenC